MGPALEEAGYRVRLAGYQPSDGRLGIDVVARQVAGEIIRCLDRELSPWGVVGFSMGGLVVRAALDMLPPRVPKPRVFLSISTPHRGTLMAWLRPNAAGRQMIPGSAFLRGLERRLAALEGVRLATIRSPFDLIIVPSTSSVLEGARNETVAVPLHPMMVYDRRVICLTREILDEAFGGGGGTGGGGADSRLRGPGTPGDE